MTSHNPTPLSSRRGSRFLWQIVMDGLASEIRAGHLQAGQKIPTERELAERFDVNENTVRRAVSRMQELGLIRGERGSGMYVREDTVRYPIARQTRQSLELGRQRRVNLRQFLGARTVRASDEVARGLRIAPGSYVKKVEVLNRADSRPFSLGTLFYPLPRFHGIDLKIQSYGSISKALEDFGIDDYRRLESVVRPRILSAREAHLLQQKRTKASLVLVSVNIDPEGTPIQMSFGIEAAWIELVVRFDDEASEAAAAASWRSTGQE